jgi:hypothetical protein
VSERFSRSTNRWSRNRLLVVRQGPGHDQPQDEHAPATTLVNSGLMLMNSRENAE